jgi:hypothetical protein
VDRYWLLTNTSYGNWLPGDRRGFVGRVWEHRPSEPDEAPASPTTGRALRAMKTCLAWSGRPAKK